MSNTVLWWLSGKEHAFRKREDFLRSLPDNVTGQNIIIDLEMTAIPILLGICFLLGIAANGALFYTICKARKLRNVPNSFLLNIAFTNILMLIVCTPMMATQHVLGMRWPFGEAACKIVHSVPQATLAISMFSLLALSIERYGAFAAPPKHRSSAKNRACVGNLFIWIIGCLCGLPMAMFAKEESFFDDDEKEKTITCEVFNEALWSPLYAKIHAIVSISFLFVLPVILCIIFYLSLSCVVCAKKIREGKREDDHSPLKNGGRSSRSGTLTKTSSNTKSNTIRTIDSRTSVPTLKRAVKRRRTMAKVAIFLMLQYVIFWAPHWVYILWFYYTGGEETIIWYLLKLIGSVCVYLNAALVPFTVVMFSKGFRHQLGKYLCCCCSCLHWCTCCEKSERDDSLPPSTSDVSETNAPKKRGCICCCGGNSTQSDTSDTEIEPDVVDHDKSFKPNTDMSNLYQELPNHNFYDSYTIPRSHQDDPNPGVYASPNKSPSYRPYGGHYEAQPQTRETFYHPASYHGDDLVLPQEYERAPYGYHDSPSATRLLHYHPLHSMDGRPHDYVGRYTSEPLLHAQAPKYSKVMPGRATMVRQATSIKEIPAM